MCGIAGFNWEDKALIKKMTSAISHRGPDDSGYFTDKGISLGHRRLSIIDLSKKGHQPMSDSEGNIQVVYNGEIYNFKKLRESLEKKYPFKSDCDTEVIVHGYKEHGEKIFSMLEGMFAIAIWNSKDKKLVLARDRVGIKPLYYSIKNGKIVFASEIKSILEKDSEIKVSLKTLNNFLNCRFSTGNETFFENVRKLEPGSFMTFKNKSYSIKKFWNLPKISEDKNPSVKELDKIIAESVEKRLIADVPLGVFLSGGLDSSTLVSYMSRFTDNIKTFSIGFDDNTNEAGYAKIVSKKFNTDHKEIILNEDILKYLPETVKHLDEPLADPASLPTYLLCKSVSKKVKVALSGEGGDEVFGGYDTFNLIPTIKKIEKIPFPIRKNIVSQITSKASDFFGYPKKQMFALVSEISQEKSISEMYKKLHYFPFNKEEVSNLTGKKLNHDILQKYISKNKNLYNASIEYYFKEWLPNDLLMKVDKTSMAHALEVRVPLLDINLIEYYSKLPIKYKINRNLFRKTVSKHLPKEILKRKKQGFTLPLSNWTSKGDFSNRIESHIKDLSKRNILNQDKLKNIVDNPKAFRNDHRLWVLLNLELWNKIYMDKTPLKKISL